MGYKGDLIAFLQTAAGWAASGDISEQSMFILYGTGANGKSTFLNVIMHILGDYAVTTYAETFMKRSNETLTNDIARLRGTRFVTTTETEQGKRLSEHLIDKWSECRGRAAGYQGDGPWHLVADEDITSQFISQRTRRRKGRKVVVRHYRLLRSTTEPNDLFQ